MTDNVNESSMKKYCSFLILSALMIFSASILPLHSLAADVSIGAAVWCAWWEPDWMNDPGRPVLKEFKGYPTAAGGPLVSVKIDETWSIDAAYLYGKFEKERKSIYFPINVPLIMIPLLISISQDRWVERHEADFLITCSVHQHVNIFIGCKYSGYGIDEKLKIAFYNQQSKNDNNYAGPMLGAKFRFPIISTLTLNPTITWVMQFGKWKPNTGLLYEIYNSISGISRATVMYYGPDITLSLAYLIRRANITLALGGRFQYVIVKDIGSGGFPGDGGSEIFGGINLMATYSFSITPAYQEGQKKK